MFRMVLRVIGFVFVVAIFNVTSGAPPVILPCSDHSVRCGEPEYDPVNKRVVGGFEAIPGAWPWTVQLMHDGEQSCAGAIINERIIMTAAHCTLHFYINPTRWQVAAGKHRKFRHNEGEQIVKVRQIVRHEEFDPDNFLNDIALFVLERPLNFTKLIKPICLPAPSQEVQPGETCVVAGWGKTQKTANKESMNQITLPIMDDKACSKRDWNGAMYFPNTTICAGYEYSGKDACTGDSGGPLVCKTDGMWFAQGIVSWGYDCALFHKPGVYTDVTKYIPWIKHNVLTYGDCLQTKF